VTWRTRRCDYRATRHVVGDAQHVYGTRGHRVYLLKIPRPFTPPGDENDSAGPNPSELSQSQILAKLQADPVLWNAKIEALRNVGLEALDIVKHKRTEELWDASDNLEIACESCHEQYWYPNQPELLKRLDRRLEELYGPRVPSVCDDRSCTCIGRCAEGPFTPIVIRT
jgi:hypothetical protein